MSSNSSSRPLDEERARWLMADLLQWHRREQKPDWWQYYGRLLDYEADDFVADSETLGGLEFVGQVDVDSSRSKVWRYRFDPMQDHRFKVGDSPLDPATAADAHRAQGRAPGTGTIHAIDPAASTIDLRRGNTNTAPHPAALIPRGPIDSGTLEESLQRLARALLEHGLTGPGPLAAGRALLGRRAPLVNGCAEGEPLRRKDESSLDAAVRLVADLRLSVLPIQGPPGTGKTFTAARVIVDRVRAGEKVAVTALSHAAISNLVSETVAAAAEAGVAMSIVQKVTDEESGVKSPSVSVILKSADAVAAAATADVIAGTAWFLAREDMVECADTLVVDEAGQLSLANVLAVASAASKLVLVGDPQQLSQPSKGSHPDGAGVSALEHLLNGRSTIPDDRGLLLDVTHRLHPEICAFISEQVYDGRLEASEPCAHQRVAEGPLVSGAGLRALTVAHTGNKVSSIEEAEVIDTVVRSLLGRSWTNRFGCAQPLTLADILVVTPYNSQVNLLARRLPTGVQIGTVDRFQGQQAPVVLVSMVASSAEDVPRGMEFLYSRNRLNVAVSRAQALCIVVASPDLLRVHCRTVEQMRLANMLCRYFELAGPVSL